MITVIHSEKAESHLVKYDRDHGKSHINDTQNRRVNIYQIGSYFSLKLALLICKI